MKDTNVMSPHEEGQASELLKQAMWANDKDVKEEEYTL